MTPDAPLIAIVGRPNVGKSTLFNRLVGGRPALVHDTPGLTRDRRYGRFEYFGHRFRVVDTGGLDPGAESDVITAGIHRQARAALTECDAVLFVVDARAGITALDEDVADLLRPLGVPVVLCANKIDHRARDALAGELYALGLGEVHPVSAAHGRGVDEMLEALVARLDLAPPAGSAADSAGPAEPVDERPPAGDALARAEQAAEDAVVRIAFVGKPNAGKSSLVNRLLGAERALVHHEPGTTTDPVDSAMSYGGRPYVLVDTAGIRRKAKIERATEKIAVSMAVGQIERADVVVLVVDGHEGPSEQDARLAGMIEERGRAVVIALNKCDLLAGPGGQRELRRKVEDELHFLPYGPRVNISALRGDGLGDLIQAIDRVAEQHRRRIPTGELNRFFAEVCETHPPPIHRGRTVRINYLTQGSVAPPTFILWANRPDGVSPSYRRFVLNRLRARYRFEGTPLRLFVKAKNQASRRGSGASKKARRRTV